MASLAGRENIITFHVQNPPELVQFQERAQAVTFMSYYTGFINQVWAHTIFCDGNGAAYERAQLSSNQSACIEPPVLNTGPFHT